MAVIRQYRVYRTDLQLNTHILYLFGDNEHRVGLGGQAGEMRGEPNAIGIRTCNLHHQWRRRDFVKHIAMICEDFAPVWQALKRGRIVVIPTDGFGTGIADLKNTSPCALAYIESIIALMVQLYPCRA